MAPQLTKNDLGFAVVGEINFQYAPTVRQQGEAIIQSSEKQIIVNLQQIQCSDNAILPLLTAWMRYAKHLQKKLYYQQVPPAIQGLLSVCQVTDLLITEPLT